MLRETLLYALISAGVALLASWPLALQGGDHLVTQLLHPDVQCGLWWPAAVADSLARGQAPFFRPELAWPDGQDTRLLLWNVLPQLLFAPLARLLPPLWSLNAVALASLAVNGVVAALAVRWLTGSPPAAAAAAAVAAANAYGLVEGLFGRPEQALWAPVLLYLASLVALRRHPGDRRARLLGALGLGLSGAVYWFYAYFLVILTALLAAGWLLRRDLDRRGLLDLLVVGLGAGLVALPFVAPVLLGLADEASIFGAMRASAGDAALVQAKSALVLPRALLGPFGLDQSVADATDLRATAVLPLLALPLAVFAWTRGEWRLLGHVVLLGALFAAGPFLQVHAGQRQALPGWELQLPLAALNRLPGFDRLWWPYRWLGPVSAALALLAGAFVARRARPASWAGAVALFATVECVLVLRSGRLERGSPFVEAQHPPGLAAVAMLGGTRPVLNLPLGDAGAQVVGFIRWHRQPIDSGLAWGLASVRTRAYEERLRTVPLLRALLAAQNGRPVEPREAPWTPAETGGFHYVLRTPGGSRLDDVPGVAALEALLGPPFACGTDTIVWAVPGVGEVPPGFELAGDPCAGR